MVPLLAVAVAVCDCMKELAG